MKNISIVPVARGLAAGFSIALAVLSTGCASIVHSGKRDITLNSEPTAAKVSVYRLDRKTLEASLLQTAVTPCVISLKPNAGYFKGQPYRLTFELPGYAPTSVEVRAQLSGWYFGNIVFGGLIGMLIVDPATGAMWNLTPDKISPSLTKSQAALLHSGDGFLVKLAAQVTPSEAAAMQRIN
jgi:hypothetical protein